MADKEFLLGVRARELLKYTKQATKIVTDDVSQKDVRAILERIAALEDIREVQTVTSQVISALDKGQREGFTKSTYRFYGEDMRFIAKQILLDVHAANNTHFLTEYDQRLRKIDAILDGCSLLLEYITICIHPDKKALQALLREIRAQIGDLGLELNSKTAIFPLRNGIDFLGFHTYLTDTGAVVQKVRQDSIDRMKGKVRHWRKAYPAGEITKDEIIRKWQSWDAHAAHGDTYALRSKIAEQVGAIIGETLQPHRKITAPPYVKQLRRLKQQRQLQTPPAGNPPPATPSEPRPDGIPPWE